MPGRKRKRTRKTAKYVSSFDELCRLAGIDARQKLTMRRYMEKKGQLLNLKRR